MSSNSVPKHYNSYSGNFTCTSLLTCPTTDSNPYSANLMTLLGVHHRSHVLSQSFSKAVVLTTAVKVLGMLQHTNPSLVVIEVDNILRDFYLVYM